MSAGNEAAYLLSWSPVAGAVSYNIKRSTVSGSETTIATSAVTHYTDNGLENGTTYYYEVSAVDGCSDESANSEEENVTPEYAAAPVFTGGSLSGNLYANCEAGVGGSGTTFTFYVSGPPNSTWTVWSVPEGNAGDWGSQIIGTITLDSSGNGSCQDTNAGTFDWSSQFYQLVSGDVSSAFFGYALEDIIDTYADDPYNPDSPTHQIYVPIQNPLVPPTATVGAVLTLNSFWYSSDGSSFDITEEGYFDDSTFQWDYAWSSLYEEWMYPYVVNNMGEGWISVNSLPYGYDSDTYYFSGFPCGWDGGYPENYIIITFVGTTPSE
jgi:hypothetical protein